MIYITGDTHGRFERVEAFCRRFQISHDDILIILGDAGINFSGAEYDNLKKEMLESLPIMRKNILVFCLQRMGRYLT